MYLILPPREEIYKRVNIRFLKMIQSGAIEEVKKLILDRDVTKKSGIYSYIFTRDVKFLNIRQFEPQDKIQKYEEKKGICPGIKNRGIKCSKYFEFEEMEADHIIPWRDGGKTEYSNLEMLCKKHNRQKSSS